MIITVTGRHQQEIAPEQGVVQLHVAFEGDDAATASQATHQLADQLRAQLVELRDREPSPLADFRLEAPVSRSSRPYTHDGSLAALRHSTEVWASATFTDASELSAACARWSATDGLDVTDVRWELSERTGATVREQVLAAAVQDAVDRARVMARAAGAQQVEVTDVADPGLLVPSGGDHLGQPMAMAGAMGRGAGDGLELSPRDVVVAAEVHVRLQAS